MTDEQMALALECYNEFTESNYRHLRDIPAEEARAMLVVLLLTIKLAGLTPEIKLCLN